MLVLTLHLIDWNDAAEYQFEGSPPTICQSLPLELPIQQNRLWIPWR